jgi:hypothetical protein
VAGTVILAGHYIDFFNMIVGQLEIDGLLGFQKLHQFFSLGLFILYTVFTSKVPLLPKETF